MTADESTFDAFVHARTHALARTAYLLVGDHHRAEDLVQTTLVKAARAWHRIQGEPEPYVRRILHHEHISAARQRRVREVPLGTYGDQVAARAGDPDLRLSLEAALRQLTPKQRAVVVLRFYEDLTEVQAAEVLGIGLGTVKSNTRQALARLRSVAPHLAEHLSPRSEPAGGSR
ncbi:SigE family RNA polymerase sigma factor [Nocardioides sp. HDW12B]|uniref:SigE family RNA polymerase sigma factor n=1 Tax=Nocardioides sp. HDW12B TaxID=2714939 RepID=UPI001F0DCFA9|nr:SigE family RNA polymerase sigma factor [Nocardioides sp. HDW12B]